MLRIFEELASSPSCHFALLWEALIQISQRILSIANSILNSIFLTLKKQIGDFIDSKS
jgi:hypothetical protein